MNSLPSPGGRPSARPRILVIEDDGDIPPVLKLIYGAAYDMDTVVNLAEASQRLKEWCYDVMLLDVELPDGRGNDLLRRVREDPAFAHCRDVPVIMMTACQEGAVYEDTWDLGSIAYVTKPFDVPLLSESIERAVQLSRGAAPT